MQSFDKSHPGNPGIFGESPPGRLNGIQDVVVTGPNRVGSDVQRSSVKAAPVTSFVIELHDVIARLMPSAFCKHKSVYIGP